MQLLSKIGILIALMVLGFGAPVLASPQAQVITPVATAAPAPPVDPAVQLAEWQKTLDEIESKVNLGPVEPDAMAGMKDRLKNITNLVATDSKTAEDSMKAENALLTALGPAPDKGVKEDKQVKKQREDLTAEISKLDAQIKQDALLTARVGKINDVLGKQAVTVKTTELLQKSPPLLTPEAVQQALGEAKTYAANFHFSVRMGGYLFLALIVFWVFYRTIGRMKEWVAQRQVFRATPRSSNLYLQMLVCAMLLLGDRLGLSRMGETPVLADEIRLGLSVWLGVTLFIFLSGLKFELPEGMDEEDTGMPVGLLNFLLGLMKLAALAALPAAVFGYVQVAAYVVLNMAGTFFAIVLFVAVREGLVRLNARLARVFAVERVLSPLGLAFFEPVLAALAFLFAGSFWGLTPGDVRDWADKLSGGITIGSIKLDFSDAGSALAVFFGLYVVTKAIQIFLSKRLFPQTHMDRGVQDAVHTLIGYTGITIALLTSLGTLGLDMAKLAIVAGALSVGIGFGLQTIVNNFVSGLILLFERPIRVGDYVRVGTEQGLVRKIRVRATELETTQSGSIIVPNSKIIADNVTNWTLEGRSVRIEITVTVAHATDAQLVKKLLAACATEHPQIRKRPEPQVLLSDFLATGMQFELRCFIRDIADKPAVSSDLRFAIDKVLKENGVVRA